MSHAFRDLLRKIGSGPHTSENLSRAEAAAAMQMMLQQEATPAQIGAFMIAHRIRRPTGEELAGMLDAYYALGPQLQPIAAAFPPVIFGNPYDGRSRTISLSPLTALVLATAGCPVILHGGDRMPTKEGEPLINFWRQLGVDWSELPLEQVQHIFAQTLIGFVYLPTHFPLAQGLVPYREQIGKRPPLATMELIWSPYAGDGHIAAGFVHPPTEGLFQTALGLHNVSRFTLVKGIEGSCDLPRERTSIIGLGEERLLLHPREYGFEGKNTPLESPAATAQAMQATLQGEDSELTRSIVWNSGFYLWRVGATDSVAAGIVQTQEWLQSGAVARKLQALQAAIAPLPVS
ncbi:MAG TPA: anthranilate phosphoribosyltransferase family protein [Leptolyngbyaceae cyanobacterium M33_DOE_097]|uniref:Anthranilate phosphoribosyltransferase family protein n=1 Tax=Oscillatoriales cyanobacterium SpSt-418 TaxID=2282169 RepID=A0A7C3KIK9_9CYAN|nr:anthranilate phosphoribosyltransferase family protein [Leptolyngbyaceae cyanobacterium M33_DOE_097]